MTLTPYPEYQDSGVDWLGEIPSHWEFLRAKNVFNVIDVRSITGKEERLTVSSADGVRLRSQKKVTMFEAASYIGHKLCWPGDLVINSLWAWQTGLGFSKYHGLISSAYSVYRPQTIYSDYWKYFDYLLRSAAYKWEFRVRSKGVWTSRLQLLDSEFMDMPILLPPPDEQAAIVTFLDAAETRIRRYIRAKQKLIKLLNEQKQAIIQQAVTRGLNPDAPMKDSGVEWLGEIPSHWETIALGIATNSIQTGPFGSQLHASDYIVEGVPVINPSHMRNGRIVPDTQITVTEAMAMSLSRHMLKVGDIVAARRGELGRCALVTSTEQGWLCGTGSLIIRVRQDIFEPSYLVQLISSQRVKDSLSLESVGATMDNLNEGMVSRLRLPCPDLMEQKAIVSFIEQEHYKLDSVIKLEQAQIDLIREYRTRLIADVVTGKVDVRGLAFAMPEAFDEDGLPDVGEDDGYLDDSLFDDELEGDDDAED